MADQLGALTLPAPTFAPGTSAGDPALDAIAGYLQAVLNSQVQPAWSSDLIGLGVAAGQRVVESVMTTDPANGAFQKEDMPILFVWRGDRISEQWTDDLVRVQSTVNLLWVTRPADQARRAARTPIFNTVAAAITRALYLGRDPAWVDPADTDPDASSLGSVLITRAGLSEWPVLTPAQAQSLTIQIDESEPRPYWAVSGSIKIAEVTSWDVSVAGSTPTSPAANAPSKVEIDATAGAFELETLIPTS